MLLNNTTLTTDWVGRLFVFGHCVRQIIIDNITIIIIKCHRTGNFHFPGPQNDDDAMDTIHSFPFLTLGNESFHVK